MSNDIEEFLRRIAEQSARRRGDLEEEEILDAEVIEDDGILTPEPVERRPTEATRGEHMKGSVFGGDQDAGLSASVSQADDRMDEHLHDVFEHRLGQLGTETSAAEDSVHDEKKDAVSEPTHEVSGLFGSAQSIRDAIIVSEIINRPTHRW